MKTPTVKSGRVVATAIGKNRRHRRAPLDHAGTCDGKPDATPAFPERIENQGQAEDFAQVVVKYFEDEIREAVIEVEESLLAQTMKPTRSVRRRKHVEK